jgi:hypothetical protein
MLLCSSCWGCTFQYWSHSSLFRRKPPDVNVFFTMT